MQVIHCPPNEDPPTYARQFVKRRARLTLGGNAWMVLGVLAFIAVGVVWGPLKPQRKAPPEAPIVTATTQIGSETALAAAVDAPVMCKLPAGGLIETGWETFVMDGETVMKVRCNDDGTLQAITQAP